MFGRVNISLAVSTSRNDTDFVVRLSDVYPHPSNMSILVSDSVVRMRWRNGPYVHTRTTLNQVTLLTLQLWTTCYLFEAGHRVRIAITSSNHPRYSANRNNGLDVHLGGPNLNATNSVFFGASSYVALPVASLASFPRVDIL